MPFLERRGHRFDRQSVHLPSRGRPLPIDNPVRNYQAIRKLIISLEGEERNDDALLISWILHGKEYFEE